MPKFSNFNSFPFPRTFYFRMEYVVTEYISYIYNNQIAFMLEFVQKFMCMHHIGRWQLIIDYNYLDQHKFIE